MSAAPAVADWRKSVLQSYRNSEVREISKVLAALEGSATVTPASKLMLAMRFEDQIFKSAKDLADYRKKISKRLKKLQKNYKRPPAAAGAGSAQNAASRTAAGAAQSGGPGHTSGSKASPGSAASGSTGGAGVDNTEAKEELMAKLKRDFGDMLRYIVENAEAAVEDLKLKLGAEKARQLKQHTDSCRVWARDLKVMTEKELDAIQPKVEKTANEKTKTENTTEDGGKETGTNDTNAKKTDSDSKPPQQTSSQQPTQPQTQQAQKTDPKKSPELQQHQQKLASWFKDNKAKPMSLSQLQRIQQHLQTRVSNIRSYVVKHADPDLFLLETLQSRDVVFSKNVAAGNLLRDVLKGRINSQRDLLQKEATDSKGISKPATTAESNSNNNNDDDPLLVLQKALDKAGEFVPPPTRNNSNKLEASLMHLDKMRAASMAMMTYWTLPGDQRLTTAPRDTLKRVDEVVQDGVDFVLEAVRELEKEKQRIQQRRYNNNSGSSNSGENATEAKTTTTAVTKKVTLQDAWSKAIELPSAATPINVEEDEENSSNKRPRTSSYRPYYKTRKIFRPERKTPQPLLAAIRRKGADLRQTDTGDTNAIHLVLDFEEAFSMTIYFSPLTVTIRAKSPDQSEDEYDEVDETGRNSTVWKPLSHGLTPWGSTLDSGDFRHDRQLREEQQQLSVWGVTSGYRSIGRVVEERLRDASTHATSILRRCFKNHVKDNSVDFEVELLEGSALLEFLQLARSTYMPHWEDEDL